jgi:hypothetical protein
MRRHGPECKNEEMDYQDYHSPLCIDCNMDIIAAGVIVIVFLFLAWVCWL